MVVAIADKYELQYEFRLSFEFSIENLEIMPRIAPEKWRFSVEKAADYFAISRYREETMPGACVFLNRNGVEKPPLFSWK